MMEEKELHLRDYLRIVNRRKSTVITVFVLIVLITFITVLTSRSDPRYRASTRVVIEKNVSYSLTGHRYDGYTGYDPNFLNTQTQIIKSEGVAAKVVEAIGAEKMYSAFFPEDREEKKPVARVVKEWFGSTWASLKELIGIGRIESADQAAFEGEMAGEMQSAPPTKAEIMQNVVRGGIMVTPIEESKAVAISFTCGNPVLSMKIANSVAKAYIDQLLDMRMEVSGYSIEWMKQKAEKQREKLEQSEKALHEYKKEHNIVTIEDRLAILPQRLAEFSEKLTRAEAQRKELQTIYNQVKGNSDQELETMSVISENASVDSINRKIFEARQQISELSKKYGPRHPKMISAQNTLEQLQDEKTKELRQAVETLKNKYLLAKSQEEKLEEMLEQTKFEAARLNEKSIQLDILKRRVDTNKYLYEALIRRMEEKGLTEKTQLVNVWVIEKAKMPRMPIPDDKKRNLMLGLVLAVFGGVGFAFFLEYLDNTVKAPEDIEERFEVPVIGTVEHLKTKGESVLENVLKSAASSVTESFKSLRTSIFLSSADSPPQVILVSSMMPQEGKTTISSCLAAVTAQAGRKILLIDGDMRRPSIHTAFDLDNSGGLSSYLAGDAVKGLIKKEHFKNLDILAAGPVPPNPSELLSSEKLGLMLERARTTYDMIIIDSPPLSVTDPIILSRHVDGVVLVSSAGNTKYEMLNKGIKELNEVSAHLTGIVLNNFSPKKSGYYYHYGDYYYSSK